MSATVRTHSCRLFVLLAREAPMGLILRRGPSNWVQLIRWNTRDDTVDYGHWFRGRIYERRCDLSPDGSLFIYFAAKYSRRTLQDPWYTNTWTAISKPPYLTALALWPVGHTWWGGGLFLDRSTVWLDHGRSPAVAHKDHQPQGLTIIEELQGYAGDEPIYQRRLELDKWVLLQEMAEPSPQDSTENGSAPEIWEKASPDGAYILIMKRLEYRTNTYGSPYAQEYVLADRQQKEIPLGENISWADWDQLGRLAYTRDGSLLVKDMAESLAREVANFDAQQPRLFAPPDWASHW